MVTGLCIGATTGTVLTNVWTQFVSLSLVTALFAFISRCSPEAIFNDWLVIISAALGLVFTLSVRLLFAASNRQQGLAQSRSIPADPVPIQPAGAPPPSAAHVRAYLAVSERFEVDTEHRSVPQKVLPKEVLPPTVKPKTEISH